MDLLGVYKLKDKNLWISRGGLFFDYGILTIELFTFGFREDKQ
jgi:hypothetical protein